MEDTTSAIGATVVRWEPILPFDQLLDWRHGPVQRWSRPTPGQLQPGIAFSLGSTRIPASVAARVRAACAGHDIMPPGRPGAPALWLSLRSMHRRAHNQLDFCRAVLALLDPSVDVYLDGFSLPDDIDLPGRYDSAQFHAWQREAAALARALIADAPLGPRLINATCCTVPQAIALGARMDAYLAPHGTQQHKIGWLHAVPGVVHASPFVAQWDQAAWLADQCEHSLPATYLPPHLTATEPGEGALQDDPWYHDYRFVDTGEAAAYAAALLAPHLAGR